ncbi:hypothetical protein EAI_08301, partial [Harpegnathos saltator]
TTVAQRIIVQFLANEGVKPTKILTRLQAQFGDGTLSRTQVFDWAKIFHSGRNAVENESHERRDVRDRVSLMRSFGPFANLCKMT